VSGVSNQRHGIADNTSRHFGNDKADVENEADNKSATKIFRRMIMMMVVMMLVLVIMPVMMIVVAVLVMVVHDLARWFLDFLRVSSFGGARVFWSSTQAVDQQLRFSRNCSVLGEGVASAEFQLCGFQWGSSPWLVGGSAQIRQDASKLLLLRNFY
jgi:hypothetical protein